MRSDSSAGSARPLPRLTAAMPLIPASSTPGEKSPVATGALGFDRHALVELATTANAGDIDSFNFAGSVNVVFDGEDGLDDIAVH